MKNFLILCILLVLLASVYAWEIETVTFGRNTLNSLAPGVKQTPRTIEYKNNNLCMVLMENISGSQELYVYCRNSFQSYTTQLIARNTSSIVKYSLGMDNSGDWAVCYVNTSSTEILYYEKGGSLEVVTSGGNYRSCDLGFDNFNRPHVVVGTNTDDIDEHIKVTGSWASISVYHGQLSYVIGDVNWYWDSIRDVKFIYAIGAGGGNGGRIYTFYNASAYDGAWVIAVNTSVDVGGNAPIEYTDLAYDEVSGNIYLTHGDESDLDSRIVSLSSYSDTSITLEKNVFDTAQKPVSIDFYDDDYNYVYPTTNTNKGDSGTEEIVVGNTIHAPDLTFDSSKSTQWILFTDDSTGTEIVKLASQFDSVTVSGTILDAATFLPIATLPYMLLTNTISNETFGDFANADGNYEITNVPGGIYDFRVSSDGYLDSVGTISISEDLILDIFMLCGTCNFSQIRGTFHFINNNGSAVINETFVFKYIQGESDLIGVEFRSKTDSTGTIDRVFVRGTYEITKAGWQFKEFLGTVFDDSVFIALIENTVRTYEVRKFGATNDVLFIYVDGNTGNFIQNVTSYFYSDISYNTNLSDILGNALFRVADGTYHLQINHPDYENFLEIIPAGYEGSAAEDEFVYDKIIEIENDYTQTFILFPIDADESDIYGYIYDSDGISINATAVFLEKWEIAFIGGDKLESIQSLDNVSFYNFSGLEHGFKYIVYAESGNFIDSERYVIASFFYDVQQDILLENITANAIVKLVVNEENNISNVKIGVLDITTGIITSIRIKSTNSTGSAEFLGLFKNHLYRLDISKIGFQDIVTDILFNNSNITYNFILVKENITFDFSGFIVDKESGRILNGVKLILYSSTISPIIVYTDSTGFYEFNNLNSGGYSLNISKLGYYERSFIDVIINNDKDATYYLIPREDIKFITFKITTNNTDPLGGVSIIISQGDFEDVLKTDEFGEAVLSIPKGIYTIRIEKDRYVTIRDEITVAITGDVFPYQMSRTSLIPLLDESDYFINLIKYGFLGLSIVTLLGFILLVVIFVEEIVKSLRNIGLIAIILILILLFILYTLILVFI